MVDPVDAHARLRRRLRRLHRTGLQVCRRSVPPAFGCMCAIPRAFHNVCAAVAPDALLAKAREMVKGGAHRLFSPHALTALFKGERAAPLRVNQSCQPAARARVCLAEGGADKEETKSGEGGLAQLVFSLLGAPVTVPNAVRPHASERRCDKEGSVGRL